MPPGRGEAVSIQVFGLPVSRGVAIGRAVLIASSRVDVAHYYIDESRVEAEVDRLRQARDVVANELTTLKRDLPAEAPAELPALLDVHLMLLHDEAMAGAHQDTGSRCATTTPSGPCPLSLK